MLGGRAIALPSSGEAYALAPIDSSLPGPSFLPRTASDTGLSIGTYGGFDYGLAKEFVYFSGGGYDYYKVSELDWPLQPSYYFGVRLTYRSSSKLLLRFDLREAIPSKVGYVQDSDYLNGDGLRTHYSRHTGVLLGAFSARADVGMRFVLPAHITLIPFTRFLFRDIKWSAQNGYYQYPPQQSAPYTYWSPSEPKVDLTGQVATYEQRYIIPAVGLEGVLNPGGILSAAVAIAFSPLAWISDIDHHLLKNLVFYDSMSLSTYVEPDLRISFRPMSAVELSVKLSYFSVTSRRDGLIVTENTLTGSSTSSAGTGSSSGASINTLGTTVEVSVLP